MEYILWGGCAFLRNFGFTIGGDLTLENLILMPLISNHQFGYNSANWFVVPLFVIQVFNVLVRKIIKNLRLNINEWIIFICGLVLGIIGVYLVRQGVGYNIGWGLFLVRFMCYIPFFELGILYKNKLEKYDYTVNNVFYFGFIFGIQLLIITYYRRQLTFGFGSYARGFNENIFMFYIEGAVGIFFWLRIANIILPIIKNSKIIDMISSNTSAIMIHQYVGFMFVKACFALISQYTAYCSGFNMSEFKSNLFYYYIYCEQWYLVYIVAGIVIPIMLQYGIDIMKRKSLAMIIMSRKKIIQVTKSYKMNKLKA